MVNLKSRVVPVSRDKYVLRKSNILVKIASSKNSKTGNDWNRNV